MAADTTLGCWCSRVRARSEVRRESRGGGPNPGVIDSFICVRSAAELEEEENKDDDEEDEEDDDDEEKDGMS